MSPYIAQSVTPPSQQDCPALSFHVQVTYVAHEASRRHALLQQLRSRIQRPISAAPIFVWLGWNRLSLSFGPVRPSAAPQTVEFLKSESPVCIRDVAMTRSGSFAVQVTRSRSDQINCGLKTSFSIVDARI